MISVLVPYRPSTEHRDRLWGWVSKRWASLMPDVEVIVGCDDGGGNPGHFNHPLAINRAADRASGDVLVVSDADVAFDPDWVREAADQITSGRAPWVLPRFYDKLTETATAQLLERPADGPLDGLEPEWRGDSVSVAGLVVVPRDRFVEVGGYDQRFTWWGADDVCFAATMDTLTGPHLRLEGAVTHLWHPVDLGETYGHDHHRDQQALADRYIAANGDPQAIRRLRREDMGVR